MEEEKSRIQARIQELRNKFETLQKTCNSWARISPETVESYAREIESLQAQLN